MDLRLMSMSIRNFKGIADLTIVLDGSDMRVDGANATGKTSIVDAFMWLLFGKDAAGDKDFPLKPKDGEGNEIHNLQTEVEGSFTESGKPLVLRRRSEEKWTKPRGKAEAVYGGNTETFWVNEVETKLSEYKRVVMNMVGGDESLFTLFTSPTAFNSLEWKKRREMLLKICGVDIDARMGEIPEYVEIIAEMDKYGYTPDKLLKVYKDRRTAANKELDAIPVRIDEITRGLVEVSDRDIADAEYGVHDCEQTLASVETSIAQYRAGGGQAALLAQIDAEEKALRSYEDMERARVDNERMIRDSRIRGIESEIRTMEAGIRRSEDFISRDKAEIERAEQLRVALRKEWTAAYERTFTEPDVADHCPTCGQPLPTEQIEAAIAKARAAFDKQRGDDLARVKADGVAAKEKVEAKTAGMEQLEAEVAEDRKKLEDLHRDLANAQAEPEPVLDLDNDPEYRRMVGSIQGLREQMKPDTSADMLKALDERKKEVRARLEKHQAVLASAMQNTAGKDRIDELEAQQKEIGLKVAGYETRIMEIEQFILARAALLERTVNNLFPSVRWQLQKTNINGGVEDCCVCQVLNPDTGALVPWVKANGAAKINAGLEIINVLCGYYNIAVPVFVDNAESVNEVIPTSGQQICLVVTRDRPMVFSKIETREVAA